MARLEIATTFSAGELRHRAGYAQTRRAAMRLNGIANELDGYDRAEAARLVGMSDQALRDAIKRFNVEGPAGVCDRPKPGRPRKLDQAHEAKLAQVIIEGPDPEQDGISSYTLDDLAALTRLRWNVSYHPASMSRVVHRLGFSRQKSRPSNPKTDPAAQAAFKKSP